MDEATGTGDKKIPIWLYGVFLLVLVGGLYFILKMKGGGGGSASTGVSTSGVAVGNSPPVNATETTYQYNIQNVGNTTNNSSTTSTTETAPTSSVSTTTSPVVTPTSPVVTPTETVTSGGSSGGSGGSGGSGSGSGSSSPTNIITHYTSTGVAILPTESTYSSAASAEKLAQLQSNSATSIPQLSASLVAYDKQQARQGTIDGVTNTNVVIINKADSYSQVAGLLKSNQGISIPGLSPSEVAYLQSQARSGALTSAEYQKAIGG